MSHDFQPQLDRPVTAISIVVFGLFLFSLQDLVIKAFSDTYSVLQIVIVRGLVALVPIFIAVILTAGWGGFVARKPGLLLLKGSLGFLSYLGYYLAIAAMPWAEVVTIVFSAPIFVTALSAFLLNEQVGLRRWLAVCAGFVAVVMVVGPGGDFGHPASILAVFAAVSYAGCILITRMIGPEDKPWTITLYSMLAFLVGSLGVAVLVSWYGDAIAAGDPALQFLLRPWVMPNAMDGLLMVFLGLNAALGFYCLIMAYWIAPASTVAPFEYSYIVWAVVFGYLVWSEVPALTTFAAIALLIGSSLYILRREYVLQSSAVEPLVLQARQSSPFESVPGSPIRSTTP